MRLVIRGSRLVVGAQPLAPAELLIEGRDVQGAVVGMAVQSLKALGLRGHQAHRAAQIFRRHDQQVFKELAPLWDDDAKFMVAARESSAVMERVLAQPPTPFSWVHGRRA